MPIMTKLLYWTALALAAVSGAAHLATFGGFSLGAVPTMLAVMIMVGLLFVVWPLVVWQWRLVPRRNLVSEIYGRVPASLKWTIAGLIVYVFVNYVLCMALNDWAAPEVLKDGSHALRSGRQTLREITPERYQAAMAVQLRLHTGHLLAFYGLAAITLKALWIKGGSALADATVEGRDG
jgi:hypothetical protein